MYIENLWQSQENTVSINLKFYDVLKKKVSKQ